MPGVTLASRATVNGTTIAFCTICSNANAFWEQHHLSGSSTMPLLAAKQLGKYAVLINAVAREQGITVVWLPTWQWYAWRYGPHRPEPEPGTTAGGHWGAVSGESDGEPLVATRSGGASNDESEPEPWWHAGSGSDSDQYDVANVLSHSESDSDTSDSLMAESGRAADGSERPQFPARSKFAPAAVSYEDVMHADVLAQMCRDVETALQPFLH